MDAQWEDWLVHSYFVNLIVTITVKAIVIIVKFQNSTTSCTCK